MFFPATCFGDGDNSTWLRRTTKSTLAFAPAMPASMAESTLPAACSPAICSLECLRSVPLAAANCGASWSLAHPRSCSGRPSTNSLYLVSRRHRHRALLGSGIYIAKGFEFRVTQHFLFDRLGARDTNLGPADQGNNGPWDAMPASASVSILGRDVVTAVTQSCDAGISEPTASGVFSIIEVFITGVVKFHTETNDGRLL